MKVLMMVNSSQGQSRAYSSASSPGAEAARPKGEVDNTNFYKEKLRGLRKQIVALYCKLKGCTVPEGQPDLAVEDREEREMLERLEPEVVLQYVDVSVEVLASKLDGANEAAGRTQQQKGSEVDSPSVSARLADLAVEDTPQALRDKARIRAKSKTEVVSERSDGLSGSSVAETCPPVYEEIIQQLESDVRKHIRIEHQLKLHIESVEDRVEELERDLAKAQGPGGGAAQAELDDLQGKYKAQTAAMKDLEK